MLNKEKLKKNKSLFCTLALKNENNGKNLIKKKMKTPKENSKNKKNQSVLIGIFFKKSGESLYFKL